jgi:glycosyltransferase involved in cell wall biosynthesis
MSLVSVLMPVYNGEPFLSDAIESILNQSYSEFELIVIDDCSTDKTSEILGGFAQTDQRIQVFRNSSNLGLTKSLNLGLSRCGGEFIARHDADDLSEPERFECQLAFFKDHPDHGLVGTAVTRIDSHGNIIDQPIVIKEVNAVRVLTKGVNPFIHGSIMMRKSIVDMVNGYRSEFRYAQDYDLWLRISEIASVGNLSERLYRLRIHQAGISKMKLHVQIQYAALACYFGGERQKRKVDSYTIMNKDFNGNIEAFIELPEIKNEISHLIGRILFCYGERERAYSYFCQVNGILNMFLRFLCKREWLFRFVRRAARFAASRRK